MIKLKPKVEKQSNGKFTIYGVPIFSIHNDRGFNCDESWMQKCVDTQKKWAEGGFYPKLILGHTEKNVSETEQPPIAGLLNNYRYADGKLLADFCDVDASVFNEIIHNQWPGRSVEVHPDEWEIPTVAMLKSTPPYLKLPDLIFSDKNNKLYYSEKVKFMIDNNKVEDKTEKAQETNPLQAQTNPQQADNTDAEYKKFCMHYERYQLEQKQKENKEEVANKEKEKEIEAEKVEPDGNQQYDLTGKEEKETKELLKQEKELEGHKLSDDYNDSLKIKYGEMVDSFTKLKTENMTLKLENEKHTWVQKYSDLRIPAGRLKLDEEIDIIMSLPEDKRKVYFDKVAKSIVSPSTRKVEEGVVPSKNALKQSHYEDVKKYYSDNKNKFNGIFKFQEVEKAMKLNKQSE